MEIQRSFIVMANSKPKYFVSQDEVINTIKICAYSVRDAEKYISGMTNEEHMQNYPDILNNNKTRAKLIVDNLNEVSDLLKKVAYTLQEGK